MNYLKIPPHSSKLTYTHTHTHTHYIVNKDLLYGTGNYTQYFVIPYKVNESGKKKKKDMYVCLTESLCCTPETEIL